jgi:predicted anti-sigma-YlaC factor YlaD
MITCSPTARVFAVAVLSVTVVPFSLAPLIDAAPYRVAVALLMLVGVPSPDAAL